MHNQTVISAKHLKKSFGTKENVQTIYSDLNMDIYKGDFTVIMGSSGGEAQRAGIVRAVINNPNVLFADVPTGALNSANGTAVLDVFSSLHEKGQSIVMVTHDKKSALRGSRL